MKLAIVFAVFCIAMALAGPLDKPTTSVPLLKHEQFHDEHGYNLEFELADGTVVKENAEKVEGPEGEIFYRRVGFYKYKSPEGEDIEVHYTADENGFKAEGNHLPVSVKA